MIEARPAHFSTPVDERGIDAYLALLADRPELASPRRAMALVTDRDRLVDYVERTGTSLGVVLASPFFLTLVDLVEVGGRRYPYSRMVSAHREGNESVVAFGVVDSGRVPAVLLVEQFRHATGRYHLELPRGFAQPDKTLAESARAELREETGYHADHVELLASVHTDTGLMTQRMAIHLLTGLRLVGTEREELELIRSVRTVPIDQLVRLTRAGAIDDGYVLQALALSHDVLFPERRRTR